MNLALRGIEADFGPEQADTFRRDLHPDLRAERARQLIALNHVNENGDAQTREFVDALLKDRSVRLDENVSLHGQVGRLKDDVLDMNRSGLSPGARRVVGGGLVALIGVSALTGITLWFGGVVP